MNPSSSPSSAGTPELSPARRQFIEHSFADLLAASGGAPGRDREAVIQWVHHRLFLDQAPVNTVRMELQQCCRRNRTIAITSGKGGVGKTTVSVNLAVASAVSGKRVLLFDADLGLANVHVFAGVNPTVTILDVIDGRATLGQAVVQGPGGVHLICGASGIGRVADMPPHAIDRLLRELAQLATNYDLLLIDTGAGISSAIMKFLALAQDILLISTPNLAATLDAYGVLKASRESGLGAQFHLLMNQADDATQAAQAASRIAACSLRFLQFQPRDLGFLQRDAAMEAASFARQPIVLARPDHFNAQRLTRIAAELLNEPVPSSASATAAA